jgi:hypothetical protein
MVPVQEMVIILYSSGKEPQLTITAGSGYIIVPGFQMSLLMNYLNDLIQAPRSSKIWNTVSRCSILSSSITFGSGFANLMTP